MADNSVDTLTSNFIVSDAKVYNTRFGTFRSLKALTVEEWVFMIVTLAGVLASIGFAIYSMVPSTVQKSDFILATVLLINSLFIAWYVVNGTLTERPYEILVLVVATFILLIYAIVNYSIFTSSQVKLARMVIAIVLGVAIIILGLHLTYKYQSSARFIFDTIGTLDTLVFACKIRYFFYSLLTLDFQLGVSMVVLVMTTSKIDTEDIVVLAVGSVYVVSWFIIGYIAAKNENKCLTYAFFAGSPVYMAYVIYKIVKTGINFHTILKVLAASTLICGSLSLVVHVLVVIIMLFVCRNFGKGLREHKYGSAHNTMYGSTASNNAFSQNNRQNYSS